MTNQEFIENILKSHGAKISPGDQVSNEVYFHNAWIRIFWDPDHMEVWKGGMIWEFPWSDLLDPSWNEKTFIADLIKYIELRRTS